MNILALSGNVKRPSRTASLVKVAADRLRQRVGGQVQSDYRALTGKCVVLAVTGGTPLHGLVLEHQLRPLFGFFNAMTVPTAIYALEADFTDHELTNPAVLERIDRAIDEVAAITPALDTGALAAPEKSSGLAA